MRIPEQHQQKTIAQMQIGDVGYVPFWAVYEAYITHDDVGTFINTHYPVIDTAKPDHVHVERVVNGVIVTIPPGFTGKWMSTISPTPYWGDPLPVFDIVDKTRE